MNVVGKLLSISCLKASVARPCPKEGSLQGLRTPSLMGIAPVPAAVLLHARLQPES